MPTRSRALALVFLVVLSSVALAAGAAVASAGPRSAAQDDTPPDPESDAIGWECGYWHNESIAVNQSDGLDDDELDAVVCRSMARVEQIRGLEFEESVNVSVQSREEFREGTNSSVGPELRTFDNAKFEAMFLVNRSTDSIAVQDRNTGESVLGYYSHETGEIVLVAENESAVQIDEFTLAHELVHALQDQHYNLSTIGGTTRDEVNARNGLVEGEARYVEYRYRDGRCNDPDHPWNGTCLPPPESDGAGAPLPNMGIYFLNYQPYSDGPSFVSSLRSDGGWESVDAAYDAPPVSAEQVIHPEKYPEETPANVTLEDRTPDEWERVRPAGRPDYGEVGQTGVAAMLVYPTYHSGGATQIVPPRTWLNYTESGEVSTFDPLNYGFPAAEGWAGDRMHVYRNDDNETAYVWRLAWDSPEDAEEFLGAYRQVVEYWGGEQVEPGTFAFNESDFGDGLRVIHENETVTIVTAPTVEELSEVRNGSLATGTTDVNETIHWPDPGESGNATITAWSELPVPEQPGFGPIAALVALVAVIATAARRRT